jgi:hypothetical protein
VLVFAECGVGDEPKVAGIVLEVADMIPVHFLRVGTPKRSSLSFAILPGIVSISALFAMKASIAFLAFDERGIADPCGMANP